MGDYFFWTHSALFRPKWDRFFLTAIGCIKLVKELNSAQPDSTKVDAEQLHLLFHETLQALRENGRVVLFPEGYGGAYPPLKPCKTGAARVAFAYWTEFHEDVPLIPVAQNTNPGVGMVISYGAPLYLNHDIEDPQEAVLELTQRLDKELNQLCLEAEFALQ